MKLALLWLLLGGSVVFAQGWITQNQAIQDPSDPKRGRLSGVVQDERGQPMPGVVVKATPLGVAMGAKLPNTLTDSKGQFVLAGILPIRTCVNASKEEAFYPDAYASFWDGQGSTEVEVPVGGEVSGITIKLTPVGRLEVRAINAATGDLLDAIVIRLERDGAPTRWIEGSKSGNWWLVPTAPIRFRVQVHGFQPAWYGGNGSVDQSMPVTLSPRQVLSLVVSLRSLPRQRQEAQ